MGSKVEVACAELFQLSRKRFPGSLRESSSALGNFPPGRLFSAQKQMKQKARTGRQNQADGPHHDPLQPRITVLAMGPVPNRLQAVLHRLAIREVGAAQTGVQLIRGE